MSGDYSRDTFDALRDHAATLLQQGRPVTDADWNEMVRTLTRRLRAGTVDTIGRAVVPRETLTGFEIRPAGGGIGIGRGRMYVSGLAIECHGQADFAGTGGGAPAPVLDRARAAAGRPAGVLDEMTSPEAGDILAYAAQPYWPSPAPLPAQGRHLAYVVAWEREITALHAPHLLEPALGGIDTTTRIQNAWQVRLAATAQGATCASTDAALGIAGWANEIAPSTARLTTDTIAIDDPEDPCLVPPTDGYTGLENQFYRVELHSVGANQAAARFKFSRENASVAAAVEAISAGADRITVSRIGRDRLLAFREGDWIEITDDRRELDHRSGAMLRVAAVHEATREIELEAPVPAELIPAGGTDTLAQRHTRIIRWDQRGVIRREDGTAWADLDAAASDGLIPVPPAGTRLVLESGITVAFSTAAGAGRFREMDYWRFAARTAGTDIERLRTAPPDGIHRHYARLAVVEMPDTRVSDCRIFWPPEIPQSEGEGCACTVCVTPESHASGTLTIQAAIDQIGDEGGTVCLEGGRYEIAEPIRIVSRHAIALRGQGALTVIFYQGFGRAIEVRSSLDVTIDRLSVLAQAPEFAPAVIPTAAIHLINTGFVNLTRLALIATGQRSYGIGLAGVAVGLRIEDCLAVAPIALGNYVDPRGDDVPSYLLTAEISVTGCILYGSLAGIGIDGAVLNLAAAQFRGNLVSGTEIGGHVSWIEMASARTEIASNSFAATNGDALALACGNGMVQDNDLNGGERTGNGLHLIPGYLPDRPAEVQVIGNRMRDLPGAGLRVGGVFDSLLVKRNVIRRCGTAGIAFAPDAAVRWLAIDNNVIAEIARAAQAGAGILGFRILAGRIAGNEISAIGPEDQGGDGFFAGIALLGTGDMAIESNHLAAIGLGSIRGLTSGILVRPPYAMLAVRGNQITGHGRSDFGQQWAAIEIGRALVPDMGPQGELRDDLSHVPLFDGFGDTPITVTHREARYMASPGKLSALPFSGDPQVTVSDNQVRHGGPILRPVVGVLDGPRAAVGLTGNQIHLESNGGSICIAFIEAGRIAAANNAIRWPDDKPSVLLSVGRAGAATVLGNITMGPIEVSPVGLNPPFRDLNLVVA